MRNTIVASAVVPCLMIGLMIGLMTGFVGCKSAPKMPWNRTAATADVESAAVAHSAPALPADIAKQAEALATTPTINLTTPQISAAPAYTPPKINLAVTPKATPVGTIPSLPALMASQGSSTKTSPTAYPSTGASPYTTTPAPRTPAAIVAAATPSVPPAYQSADKSANLGAVNMPYNPAAVPPAKTIASVAPAAKPPSTSTDRYAATTVGSAVASAASAYNAATAPAVKTAAVPEFNGSSRYGRYGIGRTTTTAPAKVDIAATYPVASSKAPAYNPAATATPATAPAKVTGDRYAATTIAAPTTPSTTLTKPVPAITMPASIAPVVASASVYRPGGTTSYAGLAAGQPAAEIATRPKPTATQTPSVTTPGAVSESLQAPRYR